MVGRRSPEDSNKGIIAYEKRGLRGVELTHRPPALEYWEKEEVQ